MNFFELPVAVIYDSLSIQHLKVKSEHSIILQVTFSSVSHLIRALFKSFFWWKAILFAFVDFLRELNFNLCKTIRERYQHSKKQQRAKNSLHSL